MPGGSGPLRSARSTRRRNWRDLRRRGVLCPSEEGSRTQKVGLTRARRPRRRFCQLHQEGVARVGLRERCGTISGKRCDNPVSALATQHPDHRSSLLLKIFAVEIDGEEGSKSERVTNFLAVPRELEKVRFPLLSKIDPDASLTISVDQIIVFGSFVCLDSFLYTFTILPLRALVALKHLVSNIAFNEFQARRTGRPRRRLRLSHKCDLTKAAILLGTLVILHHITDASKMYHGVRGQDTVKLYVLFNVLEVRILGSVLVGLVRSSQGSGCTRSPIGCAARSARICKTRSSRGIRSRGERTARIRKCGRSSSLDSISLTSVRRPSFANLLRADGQLIDFDPLCSCAYPRPLLPARHAQCRHQLLLERDPHLAHVESVRRDQGQRVQEVREGEPLPAHLRR